MTAQPDAASTWSYAEHAGARLAWSERGQGSPVLLVMGHTFSSALWYAAVEDLARHHRVITFDNRGTGRSSAVRRVSVEQMAGDAFAVMDAAGVASAHLYGVSMGGGIILEMARQQPERVRSLLLGCTLAKTPDRAGIPLLLRPLLHLPAPLLFVLLKRMSRSDNPTPYGSRATPEQVARDLEVIAADVGSKRTSVAQSRAVNSYSIPADDVRALRMPALVLHGDEDSLVPYEAGVELHRLIAHSELVTLPGAGHNYFVAAAAEANAAALAFLHRVDAERGDAAVLLTTS